MALGGLSRFSLLIGLNDLVVLVPVLEEELELLGFSQFLPGEGLVARFAQFLKQFVQFIAVVPVHVDGVDELSCLKKFEASLSFVGDENLSFVELSGVVVKPFANLQSK